MKMPQPELVIFDFDGVLVNSEIIAARVEAELLTGAGYPISAEELTEIFAGLTFKDMLLKVEQNADVPISASLIDTAVGAVDKALKRELRMIEGADRAVAGVTGNRCVCSNSSSERIAFMMEMTGLDRFLSGKVISSYDIPSKRAKPAPDVFLFAAEKFGVEPAKCFVVEDSVHGVHGAVAAGMRVIGFTGGSHSYLGHADRLTEAGAETVIRRWADFPAVLSALSEWSDA